MSLLQKNMQKDVRIAVNAINAVKKLTPLKIANLRFTAKNSPLMLRNVFAPKKLAKKIYPRSYTNSLLNSPKHLHLREI